MKIGEVDVEEINFLRDQINVHFGGLYCFYRTSNITMHYRHLVKFFDELQVNQEFYEKIKETFYACKKERKIKYILDRDRESIRKCLRMNFDKYSHFCDKHKSFNNNYITNVIKGRLKLASKKYEKLVLLLVRKYNLELN